MDSGGIDKKLIVREDSKGNRKYICRCDYGQPCPEDVLKYPKKRVTQYSNQTGK